jgi:hypothetical protein
LSLIFPAMWNREREKEIGRVWLGGLLFEYWLQRERERRFLGVLGFDFVFTSCWWKWKSVWARVGDALFESVCSCFVFFVFWS